MKDKFFVGSCVNNPFHSINKLQDITDNSREIMRVTFLKRCSVRNIHFLYNIEGMSLKENMRKYPHDFSFNKSKIDDVYFFTHSCIEYFYM